MTRFLLALAFLLLASPAQAILCSGSGPCTINLRADCTGDSFCYSSLNAAFVGEAADLTAGGTLRLLTINGTNYEDTTAASTGTGYTTSSSYYINVVAANSHGGKRSTSAYRLNVASGTALTISEPYTRLTGLQIYGSGYSVLWDTNSSNVTASKLVLTNAATGYCLRSRSTSGTNKLINSVAINKGTSACAYHSGTGGTMQFLGVTAIQLGSGASGISQSAGTVVAKDCYSYSFNSTSYSGTITQTNCAADDTTADGTAPQDSVAYSTSTGAYFTNVTDGSEDVHIANTSSTLYDNGADISGDGVTDDIDGNTRSRWDIGADEYVTAGGGTLIWPKGLSGGMTDMPGGL